jgi:hypothetical protein
MDPMKRPLQIIAFLFLGAAILLVLAVPVTATISTLLNWQGICHGFTDGQRPCTWLEFARNQLFWAALLCLPPAFVCGLLTGAAALLRRLLQARA